MKRSERTRRLIELGGLVVKAKLDMLAGDDRAVLYGAFLTAADRLGGGDCEQWRLLWGQRGRRALRSS